MTGSIRGLQLPIRFYYYCFVKFELQWIKEHENSTGDHEGMERKKEELRKLDRDLRLREKAIVIEEIEEKLYKGN